MKAAPFCLLLAVTGTLCADDPDWWQAQQEVHGMLAGGENSFVDIVRQVTNEPPSSGLQAMVKLAVLTRGRMTGQAIEALDELKGLVPGLGGHQVGNIYYTATDDARDWELARATVETFADNLRELSLDTRLLRHWEQSGWTYQQVDAWLADKPAGIDGFWLKQHVRADDQVLWTYLESRGKWEHVEQRLLWRMLENAPRGQLDGYLIRAGKLARGGHPSRPATLGWIMNRMGFAAGSIPLLQDAASRADDPELEQSATFTLLESFLDAGDWKRAERIFPEAASRLTPREAPEWLGRVAVTAAQAGAKADAMRIWKRVTTLNPAEIRGLESLARCGLRAELAAHYRAMEKALPGSRVPAEALPIIEGAG